jgi:hypothetical protein
VNNYILFHNGLVVTAPCEKGCVLTAQIMKSGEGFLKTGSLLKPYLIYPVSFYTL